MAEPDVVELFKSQSEIHKTSFESFARTIFSKGMVGLLDEYNNDFKYYKGPGDRIERTAFDRNQKLDQKKNRYRDVSCRDGTRVVLTDGKGGDYIHANLVQGDPLQTQFIATQGPTTTTVVDFWRMIQQYRIQPIVQLCDFVEGGRKKSECYFPMKTGVPMMVADWKIFFVETLALDSHISRTTLRIQSIDKSTRDIRHYHLKTWPDKHIPKSNLSVLRLLTHVRTKARPCVVHCSAGIGRTGTMIGVEMCLQQLFLKGRLEILEIAKRLRDQRAHSIQVGLQYVLLAVIVIEFGVAMNLIRDPTLVSEFSMLKSEMEAYTQKTAETTDGSPLRRGRKARSNVYFVLPRSESPRKKPAPRRKASKSV